MLNTAFRSWLVGGWLATVSVTVAISVAMGANLSTTALLLALGVAPAIVTMLLANGIPSPSVAEILHTVDAKDAKRVSVHERLASICTD